MTSNDGKEQPMTIAEIKAEIRKLRKAGHKNPDMLVILPGGEFYLMNQEQWEGYKRDEGIEG